MMGVAILLNVMDTSRELHPTETITLSCIAPEARDLLDRIIEAVPNSLQDSTTAEPFIRWLIEESQLVESPASVEEIIQADLNQQALQSEVSIPRKDQVYGCAYWLVRWSGLITEKVAD